MTLHAAVWIDHHEARVFIFGPDAEVEKTLKVASHHVHHEKKGERSTGKVDHATEQFFHSVAKALEGAGEILVLGPGSAKLAFFRHVHAHDRALEPKIVGVETVDHPTDGQLVAHVKAYFRRTDPLR